MGTMLVTGNESIDVAITERFENVEIRATQLERRMLLVETDLNDNEYVTEDELKAEQFVTEREVERMLVDAVETATEGMVGEKDMPDMDDYVTSEELEAKVVELLEDTSRDGVVAMAIQAIANAAAEDRRAREREMIATIDGFRGEIGYVNRQISSLITRQEQWDNATFVQRLRWLFIGRL